MPRFVADVVGGAVLVLGLVASGHASPVWTDVVEQHFPVFSSGPVVGGGSGQNGSSQSLLFGKFDTSLGELVGVELTLGGVFDAAYTLQRKGALGDPGSAQDHSVSVTQWVDWIIAGTSYTGLAPVLERRTHSLKKGEAAGATISTPHSGTFGATMPLADFVGAGDVAVQARLGWTQTPSPNNATLSVNYGWYQGTAALRYQYNPLVGLPDTDTDAGQGGGGDEVIRAVPEPVSLALLGVGLIGVAAVARRRRA